MRFPVILVITYFGAWTSSANTQAVSGDDADAAQTKYVAKQDETDPRFITSIERTGPCTLSGPPLAKAVVPHQLYPAESVDREEGTVKLQLIFDSDWCIRKAIVVESSKFWRLDKVSLLWAMKVKWKPTKTLTTADGEPTVTFSVAWGASQGHKQ